MSQQRLKHHYPNWSRIQRDFFQPAGVNPLLDHIYVHFHYIHFKTKLSILRIDEAAMVATHLAQTNNVRVVFVKATELSCSRNDDVCVRSSVSQSAFSKW